MPFSQTTRRAFQNLYLKISYFFDKQILYYLFIRLNLDTSCLSQRLGFIQKDEWSPGTLWEHYFTLQLFLPTFCKSDLRRRQNQYCNKASHDSSFHFCSVSQCLTLFIPLQWPVICSEVWKLIVICSGVRFWIISIIYRAPTTRCLCGVFPPKLGSCSGSTLVFLKVTEIIMFWKMNKFMR
jgi:hypothetical protein